MKAWRSRRRSFPLGLTLATFGLLSALVTVITAPPASAAIGGTFVPVAMSGSCTLATGFSSIGPTCGTGLAGNKYIYIATASDSVTYSFTVPSETTAILTYGIPAGGFVNTVAATVAIDGNGPYPVNSNLGSFAQTTPTDLPLWTSPVLAAGPHTWTITSSGDAVNVYGVWLSEASVTVPCGVGTTACAATLTASSQTVAVAGAKTSPVPASITVQVDTLTLPCTNFSYSAPVVTLTDNGLQSMSNVTVTDIVPGLPSKKGVVICYEPGEGSPASAVILGKCHGKKFTGNACISSVEEDAGSVVATVEVPTGDPRFHLGGETPVVTGFSPASPKPGKKLTVKGLNLSEVTSVTIGGVAVRVVKTAPTKVSVIAPAQAHGAIVVFSQAGSAASVGVVTVT